MDVITLQHGLFVDVIASGKLGGYYLGSLKLAVERASSCLQSPLFVVLETRQQHHHVLYCAGIGVVLYEYL